VLLDRARAARGGHLDTSGPDLPDLERVARRLDGLPLALELAAARLRVLSAGELAERLDDVLGVLDDPRDDPDSCPPPARHSTLTATVDWSYRTLGARSARLLRWLAAFAGPVDLDAIERLLGESALAPLAVLVDKSLVQADGGPGRTRYRMLDTIRAYAARKLTEYGETAEARGRHVRWCLEAVRRTGVDPDGVPVTHSMYPLDPLAGEVRRALYWESHHGRVHDGLRLVAALEQWWRERGLAREARVWLFRLYQRMTETAIDVPDAVLAEAYRAHALLAGADGEYPEQVRFNQRAELLARRGADPVPLIRVLSERGEIFAGMDSPAAAEQACHDTIRFARDQDAEAAALPSVYCLARLLWQRGALDEAREILAAGAALEAGQPAWRGLRQTSFQSGLIALSAGEPAVARCHLLRALRARVRYGFHSGVVAALYAMASWAVRVGEYDRAALLTGSADTHRDRLRVAGAGSLTDDQLQTADALGDVYPDRYDAGSRLSLTEAVRVAVAAPLRPAPRPAAMPCCS
jgi:predicted ATPase